MKQIIEKFEKSDIELVFKLDKKNENGMLNLEGNNNVRLVYQWKSIQILMQHAITAFSWSNHFNVQ